jgi:CrcB protein
MPQTSAWAESLRVALGAGFCGALTTYSTLGYETHRLTEDGAGFYALASVADNLFAGLGAAVIGAAFAIGP